MGESIKSTLAAAVGLLAMSGVTSAAYISQDFEADTVGGAPSGTIYTSGNVQVVDSASTPADPFGPAGNQSLLIQDDVLASSSSAIFNGAAGGIQKGTFTATYRLVNEAPWTTPYFELRIGKSGAVSGSDLGVWLAFTGTGITNYGSGGAIDTPSGYAVNANNTIVINFDVSGVDTWSGTFNGNPITGSGGTVTSFGFFGAQPYIESAGFSAGYSSTDTVRAFVDNISVVEVPEPAALSLIGLASCAVLARARRRHLG